MVVGLREHSVALLRAAGFRQRRAGAVGIGLRSRGSSARPAVPSRSHLIDDGIVR
ncbi:hypothetical protein WOLCODRAFT_23657 [Wolfiporia cocos MD-104 SS10]|uniref:Uncharacterized protein n=1 Tax=Wolfiporia cocos (strain MD-104) TaxID=742152 RepID=A0A2H3JD74_WOLCO|nr:hypothetical protein WOLCODRAFT_23657 [Wolfiporia cocos MD-104 SS10]